MNGGRIIASDALQGIYLGEEINSIKTINDDSKDTFDDAEIIE